MIIKIAKVAIMFNEKFSYITETNLVPSVDDVDLLFG